MQQTQSTGRFRPDTAPLLEAVGITKRFGSFTANDHIDFAIRSGEIHALLGENGAGKSTLVKIIYGSLQPTEGELRWKGEPVVIPNPSAARKLGIGMVFQHFSLFEALTVTENIALALSNYGSLSDLAREIVKRFLGIPVLQERAMEAATAKAIADAGTRIPSLRTNVEHLSGGQRQAIELNRFVHWGGKLVLLDEPFAALGVEQTRRGLDMIKRIASQGIGVVIITHIMQQAFQVADRMVVIRQGVVAGDVKTADTTADEVVSLITGEAVRPSPARIAEARSTGPA